MIDITLCPVQIHDTMLGMDPDPRFDSGDDCVQRAILRLGEAEQDLSTLGDHEHQRRIGAALRHLREANSLLSNLDLEGAFAVTHVEAGNKIRAIKSLRTVTKFGLKTLKVVLIDGLHDRGQPFTVKVLPEHAEWVRSTLFAGFMRIDESENCDTDLAFLFRDLIESVGGLHILVEVSALGAVIGRVASENLFDLSQSNIGFEVMLSTDQGGLVLNAPERGVEVSIDRSGGLNEAKEKLREAFGRVYQPSSASTAPCWR